MRHNWLTDNVLFILVLVASFGVVIPLVGDKDDDVVDGIVHKSLIDIVLLLGLF